MVHTTRVPLTLVGKGKIILDGQTISYLIKRSGRAKHVRLEMRRETGLMVVIPNSYEIRQVPDLLEMKRGWILGKFVKYAEVQRLSAKQELKSGDSIPYLGRDLKVVKEQNNRNANSVKLEQNKLLVSLRSASSRLNVTLEWWYRMQAVKLIGKRASELSPLLEITYNRLVIRGQRTRWGSCSHKGNLSFNWKLIMAPEPVIDYVIIHELAHLKEMNHTKRFWELVAEHCPRWREHKKWLKDHETELVAKLLYSFI